MAENLKSNEEAFNRALSSAFGKQVEESMQDMQEGLGEIAVMTKGFYDAFISAGFDEDKAMEFTLNYMSMFIDVGAEEKK